MSNTCKRYIDFNGHGMEKCIYQIPGLGQNCAFMSIDSFLKHIKIVAVFQKTKVAFYVDRVQPE